MKAPIRILGIAGSLRRGSYNRAALRAATEIAPKGATVETFELDGIPPFNQDEEQNPPAKVADLKRRIREANAILFVTPEYNWSVSGVLKNAIDWASRPHGDSAWNGKPAAIMGASTGAIGTARAQNHLRQILVYLNMFPINQPEVLISHAMDRFDQEGNLTDVPTREHIIGLLQNLVDWARRIGPK
jgi:chromate reductase